MSDPSEQDDDIADLLARQSQIVRAAKRGGGSDWSRYAEAFDALKRARRSKLARFLRFVGQWSLLGLGVAGTLFVQHVTTSDNDSASTEDWILLIAIGLPSAMVYTIYLWEEEL